MAAKIILPIIALAGAAFAQECSGDITINASADVPSGCTSYDGSIEISSEASGTISIDGITSISGDLTCKNATQLTAISAGSLQTIAGMFDLEELQIMSSLSLPAIAGVNRVRWVALPALQSLNFGQGIQQANQVYISNTGLTDLRGIELTAVGSMDINNNQYLKTINVNGLTNVTSALAFSANGPNLEIQFPNLEAAANLTFRNVSSISMPSLAEVGGAMGFYSNYFESFSAPNLTSTGDTIAFVDNGALANLSLSSIQTIGGGLLLANNSKLGAINGFGSLESIDGDINFYGTFDTVAFGKLTDVKGAANVYTSSDNTTICDLFKSAHDNQVIKGNVKCYTNSDNTANNGSSTSGTSGGSGSGKSAAPRSLDWSVSTPLTALVVFVAAALFI